MIGGESPEEAGKAMGLRSHIVTQIVYCAALEELLCLMKEDVTHDTKSLLIEDISRVRRCLGQIKSEREREFLTLVFNHSHDPEEAGQQVGVDPNYVPQFLQESLSDLFALLMNDSARFLAAFGKWPVTADPGPQLLILTKAISE